MNKSNPNVSFLSTLVLTAVSLFMAIPGALLVAYVVTVVWEWWAVSAPDHMAPIPFRTAVALSFVFTLLQGPKRDLVATAEFGAIYETSQDNIEYILLTLKWAFGRTFSDIFYTLGIWGAAGLVYLVTQ